MLDEPVPSNKNIPKLNKDLGIYELQIGDIVLESNDNHVFDLRFNELSQIATAALPLNIKFILLDETTSEIPYLVNIKLILEKVSSDTNNFIVEESSIRSRWENELSIDSYFSSRNDRLISRQQAVFDTHLIKKYDYGSNFFLQYCFYLNDVSGFQIVRMAETLIKTIHTDSEQLNRP